MKKSDVISKFWKYNLNSPLGSSSISLFLFLINKWSNNKQKEFILSDVKLSRELKIAINTIKAAREKLINAGFIQVQVQNGIPCKYNIITEGNFQNSPEIRTNQEIKNKPIQKKKKVNPIPELEEDKLHVKITVEPAVIEPNQELTEIQRNSNIPTFEEFVKYVQTLAMYNSELDSKIKTKYDEWVSKDWKNGIGRPITNWKMTLKNAIPFMMDNIDSNSEKISLKTIPNIKSPISFD